MGNDFRHGKFGFLADLEEGFSIVVRGLATLFLLMLAAIGWLVWAHFFASPSDAPTVARPRAAEREYSPVVPDVRPVVANHMGECFSTPMGDVGKVIEQDNEMLTMTFRGGVKSTYRFDQVTSSACGAAVIK